MVSVVSVVISNKRSDLVANDLFISKQKVLNNDRAVYAPSTVLFTVSIVRLLLSLWSIVLILAHPLAMHLVLLPRKFNYLMVTLNSIFTIAALLLLFKVVVDSMEGVFPRYERVLSSCPR